MLLVAAILITVVTTLVINQTMAILGESGRIKSNSERLEEVRKSLINFAAVNGRLPCPASGALDTGLAAPNGSTTVCTNPNGTVPWATLGLPSSAAFDGWGRKISYRVYTGAPGMTVTGGADMTNCDPAPASPAPPLALGFFCNPAHTTRESDFLLLANRPGITVNDAALGGSVLQIGFVLISHGQTGLGAWIEGGGRTTLPPVTNTREYPNTQATGIYWRQNYSDKTIAPTENTHFDDEVVYMSIADLIKAAGRGARNWSGGSSPITGAPTAINLNAATLATGGMTFAGFQSNAASVVLPAGPLVSLGMTISTGAGFQIATNNPARTAIGVCPLAGACNNTSSQLQAGEFLSFKLTSNTAQRVTLGLLNFGAGESVQITFRNAGTPVGAPVMVVFPTLATGITPTTPGAPFDEIVVTPGPVAAFYIQDIRFCDFASTC